MTEQLNAERETIAELQRTLHARRQRATTDTIRRDNLLQRLHELKAGQALDGVDNSLPISQVQAVLNEVSEALAVWTTVESELQRRLLEAENAYTRHTNQATANKLQQVIEAEKSARRAFAEQALHLVKASIDLRTLLEEKQRLRGELVKAGQTNGIVFGDTWLPTFNAGWLVSDTGLQAAQQVLASV